MLIDGYYSQLNLIDTSKWTKSHYKGDMGEYERLKKALAIHEKAAACSASWGLFQIMGFNYAAGPFFIVFAKYTLFRLETQTVLAGRLAEMLGAVATEIGKRREVHQVGYLSE